MLIVLSFLFACPATAPFGDPSASPGIAEEPKIVPVTGDDLEKERKRQEDTPYSRADLTAFRELVARHFEDQEFTLVSAGTDSVNGGLDGWRTCAKLQLTPERFGIPPEALVGMFDENGTACGKSPEGYVTMLAVAVPGNTVPLLLAPSYKTEQMELGVMDPASVSVVPVEDPFALAVVKMFEEGNAKYPHQDFAISATVLDSKNGGLDGWRTCAKMVPSQFGIPDDNAWMFFTQNEKPCADDPTGYVQKVLVTYLNTVPVEIGSASYKTELAIPLATAKFKFSAKEQQ